MLRNISPTVSVDTHAPSVTVLGAECGVEFTVPRSANSIVVRYAIPDSADGRGLTAPISLYINGAKQPDLIFTSKYAWIYGTYPFNNNPGDIRSHHFYDEVNRLTPQMSAGDKVRRFINLKSNRHTSNSH